VLGEKGPVTLGPGKITVNAQGEVYLNDARVDRLKTASFENPGALLREGGSLVAPSAGQTAQPAPGLEIRQGYLEQSNVNPIASVVGLVGIMRQFEAIQRSFNLLMNDINAKSIEKLGR
jgi:flagellar basal body rod protein FlgG